MFMYLRFAVFRRKGINIFYGTASEFAYDC